MGNPGGEFSGEVVVREVKVPKAGPSGEIGRDGEAVVVEAEVAELSELS